MQRALGSGLLAVLVTASLAFAGGGEDEKKAKGEKKKKSEDTATLERLAATPGQDNEVELKAKAGSGFTISTGDDFSLTVRNRVQVAWTYDNREFAPDSNWFDIRRARTAFTGHVFDKDIAREPPVRIDGLCIHKSFVWTVRTLF